VLPRADPALVRAAHEARRKNYELSLVELPYANPEKGVGQFLFRSMSYGEFDAFSKDAQLGDITDMLLEELLLFPKTEVWEKNPIHDVDPGTFEEAAVYLVKVSGFDEKKSLLEAQGFGRSMASTPFSAAQMFICKAFPGVTPLEVSRMPILETFRLLGMAEHILGKDGEPLQFPLREFFNDTRRNSSRAPLDFSRLPIYTPEQMVEMEGDARAAAVADTIRRRRALNADPEARAARAIEIRRQKMAEIYKRRSEHGQQAMRSESAELEAEFGRG
jgi:hypothetical protein